jgi:N-acetylgalactosamine kinase
VLAVRRVPASEGLTVANLSPRYASVRYAADPAQAVDRESHSWGTYVLCGYKGVYDAAPATAPVGLQLLVDGRVPTGSGLSSSSALVCASALAVSAAAGVSFDRAALAELACTCERYCGTQSGGMDQAISVMGARGLAKVVHFNPVRTEDVRLPPRAAFVIANSLAVSNKAETAHTRYNLRVVECRLAAMALGVLAAKLGTQEAAALRTLRELEPHLGGLAGCLAAAEGDALKAAPYTAAELSELLGAPLEALFADSPPSLAVLGQAKGFKLRDRSRHVFAEASRVAAFAQLCAQPGEVSLGALGALMGESHASCRDLYECSCDELERLVALATAAGARGARLTGAGWGGCCVALVDAGEVDAFIAALRAGYFQERVLRGELSEEELGLALFATAPGAGAAMFKL